MHQKKEKGSGECINKHTKEDHENAVLIISEN